MHGRISSNKKYDFQLITRRIPDFDTSYDMLHELDRIGDPCSEKVFYFDMESKNDTKRILRQVCFPQANIQKWFYVYTISNLLEAAGGSFWYLTLFSQPLSAYEFYKLNSRAIKMAKIGDSQRRWKR